jgi:hypothetical protein
MTPGLVADEAGGRSKRRRVGYWRGQARSRPGLLRACAEERLLPLLILVEQYWRAAPDVRERPFPNRVRRVAGAWRG